MTNLEIERLTLRVSGLSESEGRQLADLVGQRLAMATPPAEGEAESVSVTVPARSGEPLESLAQRIATEMLRALSRSLS